MVQKTPKNYIIIIIAIIISAIILSFFLNGKWLVNFQFSSVFNDDILHRTIPLTRVRRLNPLNNILGRGGEGRGEEGRGRDHTIVIIILSQQDINYAYHSF